MLEDKRRNPRVKDKLPVTIQASEETMTGEMEDLGSGGAFISCEKPLAPGETFDMSIHIQDRPKPLTTKAKVVWTDSSGMGVTFDQELDQTE